MIKSSSFLAAVGSIALVGGLCTTGVTAAATATAVVGVQPASLHSQLASKAQPPTEAQCVASFTVPCYDPAQIQTAYNEQPLFSRGITGKGQTIVIVDSYGSPTIQSDLATFDAQFGLPAPPSFKIIQPAGAVPPWDPNDSTMTGWAGETTLDVEWSHTIAPAPTSCWWRPRWRRPREWPASRRSSGPRTTSSTTTSAR